MIKHVVKFYKESSFTEKILYLYIAALPFAPGYRSVLFIHNKIQFSDLLFLILFPVWLVGKFKEKPAFGFNYKKKVYFLMLILLTATACSFINSINLLHSAVDWLGLLYLVVLFIMITDIVNTRVKFKKILIVYSSIAATVALVSLCAFIQYYITPKLAMSPLLHYHPTESSVLFFPRIKYFFHTPNMFATFEHIGLTMLFGLFFIVRKQERLNIPSFLLFIPVGIVIISLVLAGSQILAGASLTIFMILCILKGKMMTAIRYVVFLCVVAITIFAFCAMIWMLYPLKIDNDHQQKLLNIQINYAYSPHIIPSAYAISMFKTHPLVGVGIGTFTDQYPKYVDVDFEKLSQIKMGRKVGFVLDPHNTYTGALAEWGIAGFLAMLILFFQFLKMLSTRIKDSNYNSLRLVLLAGLIGFILNGFFIDTIMMRHLWIFMAIIYAFSKINEVGNEF